MIYKEEPNEFKPKFEVVSCYIEVGKEILLLKRLESKSQGGKWGLPAGKIDPNESPDQAMVREIFEETGLETHKKYLEYFNKIYVRYADMDFIYHMYSLQLVEKPPIAIRDTEHREYKWTTPSESLSLNLVEDLDECTRIFYSI